MRLLVPFLAGAAVTIVASYIAALVAGRLCRDVSDALDDLYRIDIPDPDPRFIVELEAYLAAHAPKDNS